MGIQIIADSCLDFTPAIKKTLGLSTAPLKITIDDKDFIDDETLDVNTLLAAMKETKQPISSASPSPEDYAKLMRKGQDSMVITLSRHLSGSYNAALAAKGIVQEESPEKRIHIFDSKSASAGELRIALQLLDLIKHTSDDFDTIVKKCTEFIDKMRTFFVLEDLSTLIKNGRIPRMQGMLGTMLMLRPIMGENGDGEIISIEKIRGTQKALDRMVEIVAERTMNVEPGSMLMTLSYCGIPERGLAMKKAFLEKCPAFSEVITAPTSGLSTTYANYGGIIIAYG